MKKDIHPSDYRPVVFEDTNSSFKFLTRSTASSNETIKWKDGNEYPLIKIHISSASHPFYTGEEKIVDVEGRVDRFKARRKAAQQHKAALKSKAQKSIKTKKANKVQNKPTKVGAKSRPKPTQAKSQSAKQPKPTATKPAAGKTDSK